MTLLIWIGIALCISQSAMLSGLNLAFFSISRLKLEAEVANNNKNAIRVQALREDANFLLVTILWGNVGVNVLLALLSGSLLTGVIAFLFSTVVITIFGEIIPQAYFSRHAIKVASLFAPLIRFYQMLLYPVAKPTAFILDKWLGKEAVKYLREKEVEDILKIHVASQETEVSKVEGRGALNFLSIDDLPLAAEGENVDPNSIVTLKFEGNKVIFPRIKPTADDEFLQQIHRSGKKWIIIVDPAGEPTMVLDSDNFIRACLFNEQNFNPYYHCHRPIIVRDRGVKIGDVIPRFKVNPEHGEDDVIDEDIILLWGEEKRVITGSDILGRLLRGIVKNVAVPAERPDEVIKFKELIR